MTVFEVFILAILILLLFAAIPAWPYSRAWGYYPSGILFLILLVFVLILLFVP